MVTLYVESPPDMTSVPATGQDWLAEWKLSKEQHPSDWVLAMKYMAALPLVILILSLFSLAVGVMLFAHFTKDLWPEVLKPSEEEDA